MTKVSGAYSANTQRYRNVFYRFQIGYVEPDVCKTFSQRLRSVSTYFWCVMKLDKEVFPPVRHPS